MIKAVVFDWFNTLARYDPPREEVQSQALKQFGVNIEPVKLIGPLAAADRFLYGQNAIKPVRNRSFEEQANLYIRYEEILLTEAGIQFVKDIPARIYKEGSDIFSRKQDFVLFDDVLPALKMVRGHKLIIGMLTNLTKDMVQLSNKLGLTSYLDFIITPAIAGADKPHPAIFQAAIAKADAKPEECLYVGDQYNIDVVGARGANMKAILIDRNNLFPDYKESPRIKSLIEVEQYL